MIQKPSISVSNSDDHLRNHGFLLTAQGWELSPAYDINPNESAQGLSLNISYESNELNYNLASEVAGYFRIDPKKAESIIAKTIREVAQWRAVAEKVGLGRSEQERMTRAFEKH